MIDLRNDNLCTILLHCPNDTLVLEGDMSWNGDLPPNV